MHAVISNDRIEAKLNGRVFGSPVLGNDIFEQDVSESFRSLVLDLRKRSTLLALQSSVGLTRDQVIDAYRADIQLFGEYLEAIEKCVRLAIRCSIRPRQNQLEEAAKVQKEADRLWQEIQLEIPPMGRQALLRLDSDLAAKAPSYVLESLQRQFEVGARRIPQLLTCWLQLLVEKDLIGLVEWTDVDVGRYHYFKRARQEDTLNEATDTDLVGEDPTQPFGSKNTYRTVVDKTVRTRHFCERHVHHIVRSRSDGLEEYDQKVPSQVADLIDELPALVRPMCEIVSGDITHEEIVRRVTKDEVRVIRDESVWKASPAVALGGTFALAGWSSDDMKGSTRYFKNEKTRKKINECEWQEAKNVLIAAVLIIGFVVFAITYGYITISKQHALTAKAHESYLATIPQGLPAYEAKQFDALSVQGDADPVLFGGAFQALGTDTFVLTLQRGAQPEKPTHVAKFEVPNHAREGVYGDVDLMPTLGIPATLHVLGIKDGAKALDPKILQYKITYRD